jgi:hypothetical protein
MNKNIPLKRTQLNKLGPHAKTIKSLACGVRQVAKRQKLVNQSGGFLPLLIPIIASIGGAAVTKLLDKI